jgi:hypothetical protein
MRTILIYLENAYIFALFGSSILSPAAVALDELPGAARSTISVDKVALELSNPVTALRSLANEFEYRTYQGDLPRSDDQSGWRYVLKPSWPFKLSNGKNFLLSVTIPINGDPPTWNRSKNLDYGEFLIRQLPADELTAKQFFSGHAHLDDVGLNVGYGGINEKNGFISMFGLATVFPTSTDLDSSRDQVLLGPEFALGKVTRWGLFGAQAKHLANISGESRWDTNETTVKIFFAYGLGNGWQIESNPTILYDWEAVSGNEWSVPLGAGVSNTMMLGSVPLKLAVEIQHFVVSPDRFGPDWRLQFSVTPVISTKYLR